MEEKMEEFEKKLAEIAKKKEESDKRLFKMEVVLVIYGLIIVFSFIMLAALLEMDTWLRVVLIVCGFVALLVACFISLKIEQVVGYYKCSKCGKKFVPTYNQVCWSMHIGRTRYMKCPHCGKRDWDKKVFSEKE